jgi:hypothetical protein
LIRFGRAFSITNSGLASGRSSRTLISISRASSEFPILPIGSGLFGNATNGRLRMSSARLRNTESSLCLTSSSTWNSVTKGATLPESKTFRTRFASADRGSYASRAHEALSIATRGGGRSINNCLIDDFEAHLAGGAGDDAEISLVADEFRSSPVMWLAGLG